MTKEPNIQYEKKIVVYLDLLGFRERLKKPNALQKLIHELQQVQSRFSDDQRYKQNGHISYFSDCIIITSEVTNGEQLLRFFKQVTSALLDLALFEIPIRGAITFGNHFYKEGILVSPTLVRAYELEQNASIYPRVLLDPKLLAYIKKICPDQFSEFERDFTLLDSDGYRFIHYLNRMNLSGYTPHADTTTNMQLSANSGTSFFMIHFHKQYIESYLKIAPNEKVRAKFIWLANYHNLFLDTESRLSDNYQNDLRIETSNLEQLCSKTTKGHCRKLQ